MVDAWLLDKHCENNAWGYQNHGIIVMSNGKVLKYNLANKPRQIHFTLEDKIQAAEIEKYKYLQPNQLIKISLLVECVVSTENCNDWIEKGISTDSGKILTTLFYKKDEKYQQKIIGHGGNFSKILQGKCVEDILHVIDELYQLKI